MEDKNMMREEIKRRIHEVENELQALKELVDSEAFSPKEPKLTEFEQYVDDIVDDAIREDTEGGIKTITTRLLELAKKELCKGCTVGLNQYWKGKEDARKEANKSYTFQYPPYYPPCRFGGICTNPFKDCINCPRTGGDIGISTTSGTCKKD